MSYDLPTLIEEITAELAGDRHCPTCGAMSPSTHDPGCAFLVAFLANQAALTAQFPGISFGL